MRSDLGKEFGLEHVRVVAPASHDTGSAVAAVPAELPEGKWAYISSGTWSLMGLELRKAQLSPRVLEFNLTNEGGVDGTYRLLKNIAGLWLVQQCKRCFRREGKDVEYAELVRMAAASAPLRSFIDPDANRFLNPPNMAEEIQAYCRETRQPVPGSRGALVRCALESIALKYQLVLGQLEEIGGSRVEVIHIVGGGSKNNLLNQFAADACGRPVLAGPVEATVLGNVMVQARTCAEVGSLSDIRNIIRQSNEIRRFEPRKKEAGRWEAARERFRKLTHEND
jgi:rhamnulokinase